ncbi:spermatogenesis-associated serine-rich protein 1 [Tachyglossus aculeatus]|uniref:spermatogenesis-associated serine-rich protein 1 n=1 Tax=Tachyglossus aculeatus TaxID=9261 RepID=UPI0018F779D1|nr:spermatogenesis-associated serine-rich protein 1 [Tachyglossus aculeatus]
MEPAGERPLAVGLSRRETGPEEGSGRGSCIPCLKTSPPSTQSSETTVLETKKNESPEEIQLLKSISEDGKDEEWTFYPRFGLHTYQIGKRCFFDGVFLRNKTSSSENTLAKCFGRKKYDIDLRNGIPEKNPSDKPYILPEQSPDFHKLGATCPLVNFAVVPYKRKTDTFIPLQPLPRVPHMPFAMKEKQKELMKEIKEVQELDEWKPAAPLSQTLFISGGLQKQKKCNTH